ncbi:MAG: hypothetical protein K6U04_05610 [Armatimonadetes bacterium]|nr:hypothetical protein [Armatimonadota bacterium]
MKRKANGGTTISAWCGGELKKIGKLIYEDGRPVFVQKIDRLLNYLGCCGIDLRYEPELPGNTLIRHIVTSRNRIYEIELETLRNHPKTLVKTVGSFHPKRMYLNYRHWKEVNPSYDQLTIDF